MTESRLRAEAPARLRKGRPDYILIACTFLILAFGIVMIYSSSNYSQLQYTKNGQKLLNDTYVWAAAGTFVFVVAYSIRYSFYRRWNYLLPWVFLAVTFFLLVLVLFLPSVRGVHRWIPVFGYQFQPSELAKLAVIISLAAYVEKYQPWAGDWLRGLVHLGLLFVSLLLISGLIFLEPNKSTAFVVLIIGVIVLAVSGAKLLVLIPATGMVTVAGYFYIVMTGQARRFAVHFGELTDFSDAAWQINQSLFAFGLGGVLGVGLGGGTQNKLYLPEVVNDFILGNIGEELGFLGVVTLLLVYLVVIYRCFKIAMNAPDTFSALIATGVAVMLAVHVLLNYMVTTQIIPTTGITLPLVSYGGTSTVVFLGALGLVAGISTYKVEEL